MQRRLKKKFRKKKLKSSGVFKMKERIFIQKAKEHVGLEEFVRKQFAQAKCGKIEVQRTPLVTRIVIYTATPGLVIGAGGERIKETVDILRERFHIENPQVDVQKIDRPDLDPFIVAQSIVSAIENSVNYKRLGNFYVQKIMNAGAVGCEIVFSGKFSGQRARKERFTAGYLKKCGDSADKLVAKGYAVATPKLGNVGITVKIMLKRPGSVLRDWKEEAPIKETAMEEALIEETAIEETAIEEAAVEEITTKEEKAPKKKKKEEKKDGDNNEQEAE